MPVCREVWSVVMSSTHREPRVPRPERRRQVDHYPAAARPDPAVGRLGPDLGVDAADVARAHRSLAHVPADVALWPALTSAQTLELLASTGPGIDRAYRDDLVERFDLDVSKPGRAYSTGNRQKVALVAAFATRAPLLILDEPTSGLDLLMEREFRHAVAAARRNGQTVFLSSHQLAEVEAVCDRVGILRAGRLVEVATVQALRRLHRTEVEATFTGTAPDLASVSGVERLQHPADGQVRFLHTGPRGDVLRLLAAADVTAVQMREPTLEEIFLDYYGDTGQVR